MQMPDILSDLASVSRRSGSGANGKGAGGKGADSWSILPTRNSGACLRLLRGSMVFAETAGERRNPVPREAWAQDGFECLIFRVAGLQLAVPLVMLGQVHRLEDDLTPLVGRPDWFMRLLRVGDHTILQDGFPGSVDGGKSQPFSI